MWRGRVLLCVGTLVGVVVPLAGAASVAAPPSAGAAIVGNDYPTNLATAPQDSIIDPWRFVNRECTSFVAWRLNTVNGFSFTDFYLGPQWGNAANWGPTARSLGIRVDNTPAVGAVAWDGPYSDGTGALGHVSWVANVEANGTVDVEEYNYTSAGAYDVRRGLPPSTFSGFIHLGDHLPTPVYGIAATPDGGGYWLTNAYGGVATHGDAVYYGSMAGRPLNSPIDHIVATPSGRGYWLVASDGGTFAFGDAGFYGSMGGQHLNAPVVDIAPTPDGRGYWLVASDGGIFAFGDAAFHGSMGGQHLNRPVVGITPDYSTGGYWLVASDGGIFAFGAPFLGSTGSMVLNQPINTMTATPDDGGYWMAASDGGIFAFGNAPYHGSTGGQPLNAPIMGMATDSATTGYWLAGADGGVYAFGAPFLGSD